MRKINFPLLLGSIVVILLILLSLYPGFFTSNDPLFEESRKYIEYKKDGEWVEEFGSNPMRPNRENIFGTDDAGRDVYARLVYGTRNTMKLVLLIALFRMIIALPLGLAGGMGVKFISSIIKVFNTFFTAIPMLIFSYLVLNIGYFKSFEMDKSIIAFAVVLTIVGWGKLAGMIEDSTRRVMEEDFIEGEVAIGKTKLQIAYQNILPHLIPTSISLFFKEIGMALFLIAQLSVLYVFVGITRYPKALAFKANYLMNLEPEWGGSLSRIVINIRKYERVYWVTLYPILAFTIAIIGINLTGEGLRIEFQKRESRVISYIRKTYYQLSPKMFVYQIKDIKKYYKPVMLKTLTLIGIIAYFTIPWNPSQYKFELDNAKLHLEELTKDKYEGRVTGTEGGYLAGEYIIDTLKEYGYQVDTMEIPLYADGVNTPHIMTPLVIESGWIKLTDENGDEKTYYLHKDFGIASLSDEIFSDIPKKELHYSGVAVDPEKITNVPEEKEFFPISRDFQGLIIQGYNTPHQVIIGHNEGLDYDIKFVLDENYRRNTNTYLYKSTAIIPFGDLRMELEKGYKEVEINFDYPKLPKYPGRNIMAFLPGKGKTKENPGELIIIGASYDGLYAKGSQNPYAMTATPAATAMEVARALSLTKDSLEKSIQFIFWDNEYERITESPLDGSYYYSSTKKVPIEMATTYGYYYFNISYPGYNEDKYLNVINMPAQRADRNNYLLGLEMEKRLKQWDVDYRRFHYNYSTTRVMMRMRLNALTSVEIGNPSTRINSIWDTMENINYKRMEVIGQAIVDAMTMNPYIME